MHSQISSAHRFDSVGMVGVVEETNLQIIQMDWTTHCFVTKAPNTVQLLDLPFC